MVGVLVHIEREKVKLLLFADDMTQYIENPKVFTKKKKKTLELINKFSKFTGYDHYSEICCFSIQ